MSALSSGTFTASGFKGDVAGQCETDSAAVH